MGEAVNITCLDCDYEKDIILGVGMCYSSLMNIIRTVHWRTKLKIDEFQSLGDVVSEEFEHRLFSCGNCHQVHSRFWIKLERSDGAIFETEFKCPKCRRPMEESKMNIEEYTCESCGGTNLSIQEFMWD